MKISSCSLLPCRLAVACASISLGLGALADEQASLEKQAAPAIAALKLNDERSKQMRADLKKLDQAEKPPAWAANLAGPEGITTLREVLTRHGYLTDELKWIDDIPEDLPPEARGVVLALHARQLLRAGPEKIEKQWTKWDEGETPGSDPKEEKKEAALPLPAAGDDLKTALESFAPVNVVYRSLHSSFLQMGEDLEKLRAEFIPIPPIEEGKVVKPGDSYEGVPILTRRLSEEGYYQAQPAANAEEKEAASDTLYTEELAEAVKRYQEHHGREVDGILGPKTLEELNRDPDQQYALLRVNLHRSRMLPDQPGERYLIVNIPSTQVLAFSKSDKPVLEMKTIVGQAVRERQTPVFRDVMTVLEFAPPWNVPVSIAGRTIVPNARKSSGYMEQNNYEIVPSYQSDSPRPVNSGTLSQVESGNLLVRQKPGPKNALGSVKFLFPNDYAIYLHDTPEGELFEEAQRDFSNGCIRVEKPADLAEFVLGPQGWSRQKVEEALELTETKRVEVENPVNVYIVYLTAFPTWDETSERTVRFHPDLYGHDKDQIPAGDSDKKQDD
jgi:murein L,D-transpeptidase YcbB/YkuD